MGASVSLPPSFFWQAPHGPKPRISSLRPLTRERPVILSSIQRQDDGQTDADKSRMETDRKVREMDRRLNRTLRSVCSGC
jgi:hypothetical protein